MTDTALVLVAGAGVLAATGVVGVAIACEWRRVEAIARTADARYDRLRDERDEARATAIALLADPHDLDARATVATWPRGAL